MRSHGDQLPRVNTIDSYDSIIISLRIHMQLCGFLTPSKIKKKEFIRLPVSANLVYSGCWQKEVNAM